jgi:hypothetical protein
VIDAEECFKRMLELGGRFHGDGKEELKPLLMSSFASFLSLNTLLPSPAFV